MYLKKKKQPFFSALNIVICRKFKIFETNALLAARSVLGERGGGWEADPVDS